MPVELRAATADAQGNTPTATPAAPAGAAAGDLLLAFHASDVDGNFAAMTAPAGWTQIGLGPTGATLPFLKVWQKVATGSESTSYGFPDSTGANGSAAIVALYGQHASTPVSAGPTFSSSTTASTSHVAPSVTGVAGGVLLTAHVAHSNNTTRTYTPPSGMTELADPTSGDNGWIALGVNMLALSAGGATGTKTATCSGSTPWVTVSLVVAPAAAGVSVARRTGGFLQLL